MDSLALQEQARFGIESKLHAETARVSYQGDVLLLLKPITFMNKSGIAIASALRYYKIEPEEMLVVHDDLDLPPGSARLKFDGGQGGRNGMRDIFAHLDMAAFIDCASASAIRDTRIGSPLGYSVAPAPAMSKLSSPQSATLSMFCHCCARRIQ